MLAELLGALIERIQIPCEIADWIAEGIRTSEGESEQARQQPLAQALPASPWQAKLDRGYDDYLGGRISQAFWTRKSEEWETELAVVEAEVSRLSRPTPPYAVTAAKILEPAKTAHFRYLEQSNEERRRLLDSVLSNCTFDRGSLCATYTSPFNLLSRGRETGNWRGVWDEFRNWAAAGA